MAGTITDTVTTAGAIVDTITGAMVGTWARRLRALPLAWLRFLSRWQRAARPITTITTN
jgi:hypothetical protein